jgi:hypothetical protein
VKEGQEAKRIAPLTRNRIPSASPEHSQGVLNAWTDGSFRRSAGMDGSSPKTLRAKGDAVAQDSRSLRPIQTAFDAEDAAIEGARYLFLRSGGGSRA